MSTQEVTTNELKQSLDELIVFLQENILTREEAYSIFATRDDLIEFKSEILTAVDSIAMRHNIFDQELLMSRSQYLRHEDRLEVIENKLNI